MLVLPYFCKAHTKINRQTRGKNLKLGKKHGENVTSLLVTHHYSHFLPCLN